MRVSSGAPAYRGTPIDRLTNEGKLRPSASRAMGFEENEAREHQGGPHRERLGSEGRERKRHEREAQRQNAGNRRSERGGARPHRSPHERSSNVAERQTRDSQRNRRRDDRTASPRRASRRNERASDPSDATAAQAPTKKKNRYIPALDGMRTLAVAAVIAYHMGFPWAKGGLLGVTMFFVLSGYLITGLLISEWDRSQTIDLPHFWLRRVRRLVPAIVTVVVVCAALFTIFNHALLTKMRPDILPSLVFFNNWWQIIQDVSYFDALGAPSPLTHFWSLAIEEQFYLVWPPLLLIAFKLGAKHTIIRRGIIALIVLSVLDMVLLYGGPESDPSRVYYGTDARAFSLLIGAWLAFAWPSAKLGIEKPYVFDRRGMLVLDGIGTAALVGLIVMLAICDGMSAFMYYGGILLASLLTMVVIAVISHPDSLLAKVFALPPLVWVGVRSYGIYLWHYPILLLMIPASSTEATPWWLYLAALVVIVAASALSYTFVEDPIRKGSLGRMAAAVAQRASTYSELARSHAPQLACAGVAFAVAICGVVFVPQTSALEGGDILKQAEEQQSDPTQANIAEPAENTNTYTVLLIGDSVSVRAVPYFEQAFPGGHIDAAVNRQLYAGEEVYAQYRDANVVGDVVVFALGTNGQATPEQLDELVGTVGDSKQIYFVNTRSTQSWMDATNAELFNATQRHDNAHLIDWFSYSANRGDLFDGDGTHLSEPGAQEYIALIQHTIDQTTGLPKEPTSEELAKRQELADAEQKMRDTAAQAPQAVVNAVTAALASSLK